MACPDLCPHPGEAASSPGSAAAASSPGPAAAASSPGPAAAASSPGHASAASSPGPAAASLSPDPASAAWSPPFYVALFLNGKSCTCHISSRCSLGRFCIPEAAAAEAPPESGPAAGADAAFWAGAAAWDEPADGFYSPF